MFSVSILPATRSDLRDIVKWYDDQQAGLVENLLQSLEQVPHFLISHPNSIIVRYDSTRTVRIGR